MRIKCKIIGHKVGELNDSGYPVCERCGSHSYYDDWSKDNILKRIKWRIYFTYSNIEYWLKSNFTKQDIPF